MKICSKCKVDKNDFSKGHSECKECNKVYRIAHKEEIRKKNAARYIKNKMIIDQKNKKYQSDNKNSLIKYRAVYRSNNKNNLNEYSKKYRRNKYANDVKFRIKVIISSLVYQNLKNLKKKQSISKYMAYSMEELKTHLENLFEPWMSWNNHGKYDPKIWNDKDASTWTWQIDHIIPQSILSYKSMEDEEFKKCWALDNLRPYSAKQNIIDGNRKQQ